MKSALYKAWLQYEPVQDQKLAAAYSRLLRTVVIDQELLRTTPVTAAVQELQQACESMLGFMPQFQAEITLDESYFDIRIDVSAPNILSEEGYTLVHDQQGGQEKLILTGRSGKGVLYGVFHLLRLMAAESSLTGLDVRDEPANSLRMINQWDNADGSVERGYSGQSIFYANGAFTKDLERVKDYARLLASTGVNAISINNVNVHEIETKFITAEYLPTVAGLADIFRTYGITLYLSINFAAPLHIGGVPTSDPLDNEVRAWWRQTADEIYRHIPDFGGFLVKADSEHRPGPFAYGRDHADGANMLAEALEPYGGLVIWRCFVYNCMQDWRDRSTDRARAAYDHLRRSMGASRTMCCCRLRTDRWISRYANRYRRCSAA